MRTYMSLYRELYVKWEPPRVFHNSVFDTEKWSTFKLLINFNQQVQQLESSWCHHASHHLQRTCKARLHLVIVVEPKNQPVTWTNGAFFHGKLVVRAAAPAKYSSLLGPGYDFWLDWAPAAVGSFLMEMTILIALVKIGWISQAQLAWMKLCKKRRVSTLITNLEKWPPFAGCLPQVHPVGFLLLSQSFHQQKLVSTNLRSIKTHLSTRKKTWTLRIKKKVRKRHVQNLIIVIWKM